MLCHLLLGITWNRSVNIDVEKNRERAVTLEKLSVNGQANNCWQNRHELRLSRQFYSIAMKIVLKQEIRWQQLQQWEGDPSAHSRYYYRLNASLTATSLPKRNIYALQTIACNSPLVVIVLNGIENIQDMYKYKSMTGGLEQLDSGPIHVTESFTIQVVQKAWLK